MLTQSQIRKHYKTPEIRETIMRVSTDGVNYRAGNGDFANWYKYINDKQLKLCLANRTDYTNMIVKHRTLYWTLNVFDPDIFKLDYKTVKSEDGPKISRRFTVGYTFGIDIDHEHGTDIHDDAVKKAVEDMGQFYAKRLREYAPRSVYCLYSGGGIYIMMHHGVFKHYFDRFRNNVNYDWDEMLSLLLDAFDYLIEDIKNEFFNSHPEHIGKVKPDQLNNSQRVFKTIYSVHKSLDYAVIPLDPENIKICFEKAMLPLKQEVIELGNSWYTEYDDGTAFLNMVLKPYLFKANEKRERSGKFKQSGHGEFKRSSIPIKNIEKWAPCMLNIYNLPYCGEGQTRALAVFVSFLGQIGIDGDTAYSMFDEMATRWGARKSTIFESYFGKMNVPTCQRLTSTDNRGFPKGVSIKIIGVCKPDARCMCVTSPYYYTDQEAHLKRVKKRNAYISKHHCAGSSNIKR